MGFSLPLPSLLASQRPFSVLVVPARSDLSVSGVLSGRLMAVRGAVSASVLRLDRAGSVCLTLERGLRRCCFSLARYCCVV